MTYTHRPVLLAEAVTSVLGESTSSNATSKIIIDGTFGRGGHSREILKHLNPASKLIAFDKDPQAIAEANTITDSRFQIIHESFDERAHSARNGRCHLDGLGNQLSANRRSRSWIFFSPRRSFGYEDGYNAWSECGGVVGNSRTKRNSEGH
jgi:16S rRNA C1402 N4-methylase RsmH